MAAESCRVCNGVVYIQIRKGTGLCSLRCEKREAKAGSSENSEGC